MSNNRYIEQRILDEADYFIKNNSTVRKTAEVFGMSTSTVYLDLTKKLRKLSKKRYQKVVKILKRNKKERSKRGGEATKINWASINLIAD